MNTDMSPANSLTSDEAQVRKLYQQIIAGWNEQNEHKMVEPFSEQGELIGFDGSQASGKADMLGHLHPIFAKHPTPVFITKIRGVQFLGAEGALLRAAAGMVPRGKSALEPAFHTHHTLVAKKDEGKWQTVLFQNTPAQFHNSPELVQAWTEELTEVLNTKRQGSE